MAVGPNAWTERAAPSLDDFEQIAAAAFEALPPEFKALAGNIPCVVAEFPDAETIREMELDSEFDILGLFRGIGLPQGGATPQTGQLPNQVWLYRRPILDYWAESETGETLGEIITHVLVHEIGHHFGFSDDDMEAIEAAAEQEG
ncbi:MULTISPECIES: metallopeptidase family protein [unclassified Devosia]|uniref:metallopeptidase family protein n=1 Tax=unclassified Devosia TaxID=196773 RepID=UPI00086BDB99|nr:MULTISPECIES: metallopeptidase family protein [unclassified Devosia]MBN9362062.1 metallopeptidase family protein [Devosia sp.]ODS81209.1 MAG: Zn-dependent protease [Devosia sp. SCN 66-27]OJX24666.1 MAG: Zn-dependent protease [Devosia sp. 66-14]